MGKKHIMVLGAGLVGSLLSTMLAKKGFKVSLYERRPDMRKTQLDGGRSINLALSKRGLKALEQIGIDHKVKKMCIPMHGRMIHDRAGNLQMQPYGMNGEFINSISRAGLNELLMNEAERNGVKIYFDHKCTDVDFDKPEAKFENEQGEVTVGADFIFGADGAFSALRNAYLKTPLFNYSQQYITAGYKELVIPATPDGDFAIASNALHIWPRGSYMLIALPNLDKSFTVTLFFPMKGQTSFETLSHKEAVQEFFEKEFADATELMPTLVDDFFGNPTSGLVTVRCNPWVKGKTALIGDAAHAIVPFYGQGMNAGFEDCFVLGQLLDKHEDLNRDLLKEYEALRIPDAEAIADLALYNFIEMRDKVADPQFILQKKIEKRLNELYPKKWLPLYPMVTFSDLRYSEAHAIGKKQQAIMDEVLKQPSVANNWEQLDFEALVEKLG
ncbi:kynurenine 3-monooxygenase [Roseivirga pacifica]|uniref:Kynurenine 3-monooxygenase n=1 Tax=Roseivirga pacifica TaxID=1267423 RepID=A0A1I0NI17_9BACT|nr:NAD(P)/FAD-dependent oxidoreductase [Roseivirga pacifica]RKQ51214.1 kynurenine 3-monooxygenase [Roseivirga pacifica]SEW01076.1 kynurenine 3-monooxygenase [Roseivirga pacifica]